MRRYTADGLCSPGMATPVRVNERHLFPRPTARLKDGKRVRAPIRSAASWSSEMLLRKAPLPGCGAAVRNVFSAACPPSTEGCETPLKTVMSLLQSRRMLRYGVSS